MFGKKKQKQETLVRMRNLAQLDEGFFSHMKDGKDMFIGTAREIRKSIEYWQGKVNALENAAKHGGRNRVKRFVPRDL